MIAIQNKKELRVQQCQQNKIRKLVKIILLLTSNIRIFEQNHYDIYRD